MAATSVPAISITDLSGGLDDNDSLVSIPDDACTVAENVEFFYSSMGERRLGCTKVTDLPAFITALDMVSWMGKHYPSNSLADTELWTLARSSNGVSNALGRRTKTAWSQITPSDAIISTTDRGHRLSVVSLHGKFFIAYKSAVDYLHVWDGTSLRQTGLAQPGSPAAADTAGAGTFATARYYRVRYVVMSGSTVLLRSEPSSVTKFTPVGNKDGATITKPGGLGLNETHWELEASTDNANFYRVAQIPVSGTTYTDNAAFVTGYSSGIVSEDLTAYSRIPSGKFLSVDADRLLIAGSWENSTYASRVWWTPVFGQTGVGNDERLDMTVNPYLDLDGFQGGEITGMSKGVNGYVYVFKWGNIYKLTRTGQRSQAYSAVQLTSSRGALPGSLVEAVDQSGQPALFFLDPKVGPMRLGQYGLEWCGRDIKNTWRRVNLQATVPCHGIYYPSKNQVHWWIAVDGSSFPNMKIVVQLNSQRSFSVATYNSTSEGARRGWSTVPVGDRIAAAHCSIVFDDNVDSVNDRSGTLVPFIGIQTLTVDNLPVKDLIQRCDTGATDGQVSRTDLDSFYYASVQTKAFIPTGLLQRFGVKAASLLVGAVSSPTNNVYLNLSKDFGAEDFTFAIDLAPTANETTFVARIDQASSSSLSAVQFKLGDLNPDVYPTTSWKLYAFSAKVDKEATQ